MGTLRDMRLPKMWLDVAEAAGVDAFLAMWRAIDAQPNLSRDTGMIEITMRPYASFLRAQRNRYIRTLGVAGHAADDIQTRLLSDFGERLSLDSIKRIVHRR